MGLLHDRQAALAATRERLRALPVNGDLSGLPALRDELRALATRTELFDQRHFPVRPGRISGIHRLFEDPLHGFALYVAAGLDGHRMAPHRHPGWAIFVGIQGQEDNVLFERTDDGLVPGQGRLARRDAFSLGPGDGLVMGAHEFHETTIRGPRQGLHFHFYGVPIDTWGGELPVFATGDATTYEPVKRRAGERIRLVDIPDTTLGELQALRAAGEAVTLLALGEAQPGWAALQPLHHVQTAAQVAGLAWPDDRPLVLLGEPGDVQDAAGWLAGQGHIGVTRLAWPGPQGAAR